MKAATIVLLLALGALALAHRDGSDDHYKKKDYGYKHMDHGYKKKDHDHDRYNHHSSSSSPEHRYRHREHRRKYKRDTAAVTPLPDAATTTLLPATTTLPLATTVAPKGRQADSAVSTTSTVPIVTTTPVPTPTTTTVAAKGRQADFMLASTSTTEMPTSAPSVIGKPIQTAQDCDFSCKFFTLVNAEDGTPVSFNYRTSPTCLQVDAFCEAGFTLVTYGSFAPVPLDSEDNGHGIINCFNSTWFDMNGESGSNVMCMNDANVNHKFTSTTPVSSADLITEVVPIEQTVRTTTNLPFAPEAVLIEQTMQTTTILPFAPIEPTGGSDALGPRTTQ